MVEAVNPNSRADSFPDVWPWAIHNLSHRVIHTEEDNGTNCPVLYLSHRHTPLRKTGFLFYSYTVSPFTPFSEPNHWCLFQVQTPSQLTGGSMIMWSWRTEIKPPTLLFSILSPALIFPSNPAQGTLLLCPLYRSETQIRSSGWSRYLRKG